jgi:hypothetical protein
LLDLFSRTLNWEGEGSGRGGDIVKVTFLLQYGLDTFGGGVSGELKGRD